MKLRVINTISVFCVLSTLVPASAYSLEAAKIYDVDYVFSSNNTSFSAHVDGCESSPLVSIFSDEYSVEASRALEMVQDSNVWKASLNGDQQFNWFEISCNESKSFRQEIIRDPILIEDIEYDYVNKNSRFSAKIIGNESIPRVAIYTTQYDTDEGADCIGEFLMMSNGNNVWEAYAPERLDNLWFSIIVDETESDRSKITTPIVFDLSNIQREVQAAKTIIKENQSINLAARLFIALVRH